MSHGSTQSTRRWPSAPLEVPCFRVRVVAGPDAGAEAAAVDGRLAIGTAERSALRLTDPTVSRFHVEFEASDGGIAVRDLGSTNGTLLGTMRVRDLVVREPLELDIGRSRVRLELEPGNATIAATAARSFGGLIGGSPAMRAVYSVLERAAPTTAPVLITGESGTGKELAARAIHAASDRATGPFEVVDCGGLPPTLVESELFGHERGSFTGAQGDREGAFERADHGTIFLDELGELPLDVQPKLLRALGEGEVRRVGGKRTRRVDVRVVAATNRDVRREVNAGGFRADLFYRLAVIQVRMPPLRERLEDLPALVTALLAHIERARGLATTVELDADFWAPLASHTWPGNVRELRNYLEQLVILRMAPALVPGEPTSAPVADTAGALLDGLDQLPMRAAKAELLERFERRYVTSLLAQTDGNIAEAARRAGVDRGTLFRTVRRHGLRRDD